MSGNRLPTLRTLLFLLMGLIGITGCASKRELAPFRGDGCTLFPDSWEMTGNDWSECCHEHDLAYWQGGSKEERWTADLLFRDCILEKTGNQYLADTMYNAVRLGGTPHFPSWYRWGYGWNYGRGYAPLTEAEKNEVRLRLDECSGAGDVTGEFAE